MNASRHVAESASECAGLLLDDHRPEPIRVREYSAG